MASKLSEMRWMKNTETGNIKPFDNSNEHILREENMIECNKEGIPLHVIRDINMYNAGKKKKLPEEEEEGIIPESFTDMIITTSDDEENESIDMLDDSDEEARIESLLDSTKIVLVEMARDGGIKFSQTQENAFSKRWFAEQIVKEGIDLG